MRRSFLDDIGDVHALAAARIAFGVLLLVQAWETATEQMREGYFGAHFHWPYLPESFVPSERGYALILCAQAVMGVLVVLGESARPALFFSGVAIAYAMLCDRLHFHHNRWALACYVILLSFTPCDRARTFHNLFRASKHTPATGPLWAMRLAQIQVSIVYLASSTSKLLDPDWRSGMVIYDRLMRYGHVAIERGTPERVVSFFQQESVASVLSKGAIATELFLAFALATRRLRILAIFVGLCFHGAIELSSRVELFSFTTFAAYLLFATPDSRARSLRFDKTNRGAVVLAWIVRGLDWLARFDVAPWAPDALASRHAFVVTDRDGLPHGGFRGVMTLLRALPLTFPIWALLFPFARGGRKRVGSAT